MTLEFQNQISIQPTESGGGGGGGGGSDTAKGGMLPQETTFNKLQFKAEGELQ